MHAPEMGRRSKVNPSAANHTDASEIVSGPSLCVGLILSCLGCEGVRDLVAKLPSLSVDDEVGLSQYPSLFRLVRFQLCPGSVLCSHRLKHIQVWYISLCLF